MLLARKFEITKTSRESLLAAYDCCLAHPTSPYTLSRASLDFAGRSCLYVRSCSCPLVECIISSVGGEDRLVPRFVHYLKFGQLQRIKVEV